MATSNEDSTDQPPYPSWSELKCARKSLTYSKGYWRIHWPLEGEYPAAISVAAERRTAIGLEPFYDPTTDKWHDIADLPLTTPVKISSITAEMRELNVYERDWVECHRYCAGAKFVTYGDLDDDVRPYAKEMKEDGSWEEDSDTEYLIRCCGEERPIGKRALTLKVVPPPERDYLTIRDYISALHPFFMSLREDIMKAKEVAPFEQFDKPRSRKWMILPGPLHSLSMGDRWPTAPE
ncbi:uncharacterized protein B0I36DRAFT_91360 [Microdochium trichocladiopsis]|uniref:Uncharacterized protein n=1 Tax=Microdochium trichocladiopsis TaxID=1682393 RepID=A0A9P8Y983_9PEZI|nr:uncharacterized protein B0I36DRAFT_91360 [Microdochium trichocladiopsis]KAH7035344.1 hypothetical protein B0I36DRAFT_91360 [Microdochium trichocladiopsis]